MTDAAQPAPAAAAPAPPPPKPRSRVKPRQALWLWPGLVLLAGAGLLLAAPRWSPGARANIFLVVAAMIALCLALVGWLVRGRLMGVFVDNRNRLSLSKLQAGAWTVIVIAAFATAAAFNAEQAQDPAAVTALDIVIPGQLLLAMGISAASLVATPAVLSLKASQTPSDAALSALPEGVGANGKVLLRQSPDQAAWSDLVTGDEVGNADSVDLGKIQQILISLVLLGCYAGYVYAEFARLPGPITQLPVIDESFVWLLGVSHASYLAYKAAPHTATASG